MGGQTDATPLRMETDQHDLHVLEIGSTRPHLPIHHPQPSLDGPGAQVSRLWLGLEEGLAQSPLGFTLNGDFSSRTYSQTICYIMTLIYLP